MPTNEDLYDIRQKFSYLDHALNLVANGDDTEPIIYALAGLAQAILDVGPGHGHCERCCMGEY